MKPFWGINVTENKRNDVNNGEELCIARASAQNADALTESRERAEELIESAKLPFPLRLLRAFCGFIALVFGASLVVPILEIGLAQSYSNAPALFWLFFASLIIWVLIRIATKKKEKSVLAEGNVDSMVEEIRSNVSELYSELNVPEDALTVDLILFRYKIKDGEVKPDAMALMPTAFINVEARIFARDGSLCIADVETLYAIPLESIKRIRRVDKRISVPNWNKEVGFNEGEYKKYKMTANNMGCVFFKPYYILEFEYCGEEWGLYFPPYELEQYEKVTGITATEE